MSFSVSPISYSVTSPKYNSQVKAAPSNNEAPYKIEHSIYNSPSFGMAKIVQSSSNPECTLTRERYNKLAEIYEKNHAKTIDHASRGNDDEINFEDTDANSEAEIALLLKGKRQPYLDFNSNSPLYMRSLIRKVNGGNNPEVKKYFYNARDMQGNNVLSYAAASKNPDDIDNIPLMLEGLADMPKDCCALLLEPEGGYSPLKLLHENVKDEKTPKELKESSYRALLQINDRIYDLAVQTPEVTIEEAKKLLTDNEGHLDGGNKAILNMFRKGSFAEEVPESK